MARQATKKYSNTLSKYGFRITTHNSHPTVQVEIWSTGKPRREFLWSEDMADACVFLMKNSNFKNIIDSRVINHEIRNTHINIGTGKDISIKELTEIMQEQVGFMGKLYFNSDKPDGTMIKLTDPSKLNNLGWKHTVELKEGIEKMYVWCKESCPTPSYKVAV